MSNTDPQFKKGNRGVNLNSAEAKIYFFERHKVTVAKCWPKPAAWQKSNHGWKQVRLTDSFFHLPNAQFERDIWLLEHVAEQSGQLRFPFMMAPSDRDELNRLRWYSLIPIEIRRLLVIYRTRQWHLLSFLARCGEPATDLVRSSPALAFALASNWVFHKPAVKRPLRSARNLLRRGRSQKDILAWLGFPPTKSVRRLLARVVPASIDVAPLLYLRDTLRMPGQSSRFAHVERLNAGVIRILTDPKLSHAASPRLIRSVSQRVEDDRVPHSAYLLRDSARMFEQVFPNRRFPDLRSVQRLQEFHDELTVRTNRLAPEALSFPKPPVNGNDHIVPILNPKELKGEGIEMKHCVSSYSRQIAWDRNLFVYKVLAPERCTLSIYKSGSEWRIGELKRSSNREVSEITRSRVGSWLQRSSTGKADPLGRVETPS